VYLKKQQIAMLLRNSQRRLPANEIAVPDVEFSFGYHVTFALKKAANSNAVLNSQRLPLFLMLN
jgi:hypothetical protein